MLNRIALEVIPFDVRRAPASLVSVCLRSSSTEDRLEVNGDGRSFSRPEALAGRRCGNLGLIGRRERVEDGFGGAFDIDSAPGRGTAGRVSLLFRSRNDNRNGK